MTELTPDDFISLAVKLDGLELTETESAILDGILRRAAGADDEVSGFSVNVYVGNLPLTELDATANRLTVAMGFTKDDSLWQ